MTLERDIQLFNQQIERAELIGKNKRIIMTQYTNTTRNSDDWKLHFHSFPYSESMFVLLVLLYGLKIQLRKPNRQRNAKLIKDFQRKMIHLLNTLMNYCAYLLNFDDTHIKKCVRNAKVVPYENKTIAKIEKKKMDKYPWDITQEIILEWNGLPWQSNGL